MRPNVLERIVGDEYIADPAIVTRVTPCTRYRGMTGAGHGWERSCRRTRLGVSPKW